MEIKMSDEFKSLKSSGRSLGETNDCAVIALAVVTSRSYAECHKVLADLGRKPRKGTFRYMQEQALNILGFKFVCHYTKFISSDFKKKIIDSYPETYNPKNLTVKQISMFPKAWSHYDSLMVFTDRHVSGVKNGKVCDWAEDKSKHIQSVWVVTPKESCCYRR
jgi:hypothetical protein